MNWFGIFGYFMVSSARWLVIATWILVTTTSYAKVVIQGKILHYDGRSIVYYHPTLEGIHTYHWYEIKPASNGSFRIEFENEGFGTTNIGYLSHVYRLAHDQDSRIEITIDQQKMHKKHRTTHPEHHYDSSRREAMVSLTGSYLEINLFYNTNLRTAYSVASTVDGNYYSHYLASAKTPEVIRKRIDSLVAIEVEQISRLHVRINSKDAAAQHDESVEKIKSFLTNEVYSFYGNMFLNAMFLKKKNHIYAQLRDSTSSPDLYNRKWEQLIEEFVADARTNIASASNSKDYNDMLESLDYTLKNYQKYHFPQSTKQSLDELLVERMIKYDTTIFSSPREQYAHVLRMMQIYLNDQLFYSPELLNIIYDIESRHVASENLRFFGPKIDQVKNYLVASEKEFDKARIINSKHETFSSLLNKFAGKYLLVDIWATWCHPCIDQFRYKHKFQHFIDSGKIEVLYISIDKPEWADRWKKSIRFNLLEGSHFRADQKFIIDMWKTLKGYEGAIPRYALIDKHGKIFKATAAQPADGEKLVEEIRNLLDDSQQLSDH
jgi:thiol-disulfide isomerase/thioredoxin